MFLYSTLNLTIYFKLNINLMIYGHQKNMNRSIFMQQFLLPESSKYILRFALFGGCFLGSSHTSSKGVWMYTLEDLKWNIMNHGGLVFRSCSFSPWVMAVGIHHPGKSCRLYMVYRVVSSSFFFSKKPRGNPWKKPNA